jgi:hypothetical protein
MHATIHRAQDDEASTISTGSLVGWLDHPDIWGKGSNFPKAVRSRALRADSALELTGEELCFSGSRGRLEFGGLVFISSPARTLSTSTTTRSGTNCAPENAPSPSSAQDEHMGTGLVFTHITC